MEKLSDPPDIYADLAKIQLDKNVGYLLSELFKAIEEGRVRKDCVFLSLLANKESAILSKCIEWEIERPLNLRDGLSIFDRCYYKDENWFRVVLNDDDRHLKCFDASLRNDFCVFKLIQATNNTPIDITSIEGFLKAIGTTNDELMNVYVNEIRYILKAVDYCKANMRTSINDNDLFELINNGRLLGLFDAHFSLNEAEKWPLIEKYLRMDEERFEFNSESVSQGADVDEFTYFVVLASLIKALHLSKKDSYDVTSHIENARNKLATLHGTVRIEALRDVFTLCFLPCEPDQFFCTDRELRLLLHFVKPCLDELNATTSRRSPAFADLDELNRHVKEALWRLEMLDDASNTNYQIQMQDMLADSETLIATSMKRGRFDKVHQVIQIFNLQDTQFAKDVVDTERLIELRAQLANAFKLQKLHRQLSNVINKSAAYEKSPRKYLDDFLGRNKISQGNDLLDVAFTAMLSHQDQDDNLTLLPCIDFSNDFHLKCSSLFESSCVNFLEWYINPKFNSDLTVHNSKLQYCDELGQTLTTFHKQLAQVEKDKHLVYKTYTELKHLGGVKESHNYLQRLFNYLKIFLRVFTAEGNHIDLLTRSPSGSFISYFEILHQSRTQWIGKLFERDVDPRDLEHLYGKLKLDLLYATAGTCFPHVEMSLNLDEQKSLAPSKVVFTYIAKRNWLLAFLINEIYALKQEMDVNETRTKYFMQYVGTREVDILKILFGGNKIVAALHRDYYDRCMDYLKKNILDLSGDACEDVEAAEEILENHPKCNWLSLLKLVDAIAENKIDEELNKVRDRILSFLVTDTFEEDSYQYVKFVQDDSLRRQLILDNFTSWPGDFCVSLLRAEDNYELLRWSETINFCEEVRHLFDFLSWYPVHELSQTYPRRVFSQLLTIPKASLLLDFEDLYDSGKLLSHIPIGYLARLFTHNKGNHIDIEQLLNKSADPISACLELMEIIRNLSQLEFIIDLLVKYNYADEHLIKNVRVSAKILGDFPQHERELLWCLIRTPLAIIEMLVMNTRLDKLGTILERVRDDLANCEFSDDVVSLEAVDELLRSYAEKSLEFRVILKPNPRLLKGSDCKLMESLDSLYGPDRKCFQMPEQVPTKPEWIPNDEVLECMCCQNTTFSMFNRRHHCRRCGRVVCFNCSARRMHVATYGDIMVRVCLDCYDQSRIDAKSDSASNKSVMYDHWLLSDSCQHNAIVRSEFSYEHAPSVSLCLSIMKHHTKTELYPRFLLDQCDSMLKLLQPPAQNAPQEVDYILVIKMLKSLAIAAKMLSAECQLAWGSSQADRILSQADLFALLAERGCLNLLPPATSTGAPYIDAIILRKLRDKLLMQEQWHFALDVSTKAGLDNAGVFGAWGKSCLKAGCLQLAREKFQRCLDKSWPYDSSSLSLDETRTFSIITADNKPLKDPPLLEQIIEILESKTVSFTRNSPVKMHSQARKTDKERAILIKAKLHNLKAIVNGNLEVKTAFTGCNLDPAYFQECLYYLKRYGSHLGLLQFYLKHNCIRETLIYIAEHKVPVEVFIDVYVTCLRDGKINSLQKQMSRIDSTLEVWKHYLRAICRHLEQHALLHSLYQLQQFMVDYVRAAMTCIRFYKDDARTYQELETRTHFLEKAEGHLLQELEQQQWVEVNAVVNNVSSDSSYEEKPALSNPSIVMKMDSRTIDQHIRTIKRQMEITRFLSQRESDNENSNGGQIDQLLVHLQATPNIEGESKAVLPKQLPTLFDSHVEKSHLAVILIICGQTIQDGYPLAVSLLLEYKLRPLKVYCQAGRQLARQDRYNEIAELVNCVRSTTGSNAQVNNMCDEMLTLAVRTLSRNHVPTSQLEGLIKLITDRATKISIYIETKQLKSAYLLAAKYNRFGDIRRILREAELVNKQDIKKLCQKLLQVHSHSKD